MFLGGIEIAADLNALHVLKIEAVLTVAANSNLVYPEGSVKFHELIEVEDSPNVNLF